MQLSRFCERCFESTAYPKTLKFAGNLGSFLESLKRGVAVDHEFEDHHQLDEYVKANIKTLDKREKEYLLCLYFQFHAAECKLLTPEEADDWVCPIESCRCGELDYQIDQDATTFLLNYLLLAVAFLLVWILPANPTESALHQRFGPFPKKQVC